MSTNNNNQLIKIAFADDHILYREALSKLIDSWENCKVIYQACNGRMLMEMLNPKNLPDILLTDLAMPEMNGYETIKAVKEKFPAIKIITISVFNSDEMIWKIIKCGAQGFVSKSDDPINLKRAVLQMMHTGYYFSDRTATNFIKQTTTEGTYTLKHQFTDQEIEFLRFCCTNKTYKEIAKDMDISDRQVEYLRNNLFERFNAASRTDLALNAIKKGLVV